MTLNIVFITQDDPFYVRVFFEEFMRRSPNREELKAIVVAPAMGKKSFVGLLRQMYDFYGPWNFVRVGVRYVLFKFGAKLPTWLRAGRFFSVAHVGKHYGVPVMYAPSVNAPDFLDSLRQLAPDLVISVAAPQVFRGALISLPRHGCINIHNSKLPKYRGMLPNFWQMFSGEKAVGTTIHRINSGIDDGDIVFQAENSIVPGESLDSLIVRTKRQGAQMMIDVIEKFRTGRVQVLPNPKEEATYFTFPTRADVREFRKRGYRLL